MLLIVANLLAAADGGEIFVDKGACPGEGCAYGESWITRSNVTLRAEPSRSATIVAKLDAGTRVTTVTGEVHTKPTRFVVHRPHAQFRPGDSVLVYTYLGEGVFRVRHNGRLTEADLGFSPWGGTAGTRCEQSARCWGTLEQELRFEWWVQVRTPGEVLAWTAEADKFEPESRH